MRSSTILSIIVASVAAAPLPQFDLGALLGGGAGGAPGAGSGGGRVSPLLWFLAHVLIHIQALDLCLVV
jgi:hypothetical protein